MSSRKPFSTRAWACLKHFSGICVWLFTFAFIKSMVGNLKNMKKYKEGNITAVISPGEDVD
jgi:uncharacterized membrane protein YjfL (UPF0719 family)